MDEIILSNKNNNLQYLCRRKTKQGYIEENISYSSLKKYLIYLSENKSLLGTIKIMGNDLIFTSDRYIIKLLNYKDFKNKKRFSFIFDELRRKNYRLVKDKIVKGTALAVAGIATIGAIDAFSQGINKTYASYEESSQVLETEAESYSDLDEIDFVLPKTSETTTEVTTKNNIDTESEVSTIKQDDKYDRLCVGSMCDDEKSEITKKMYYSLFEKYANKYGLDPDIICAIATQERGVHSSFVDKGGAIGLMQIQVSVWNNKTIYVYDYETNQEKKVHITLDALKDVEKNIEIGCAIFQSYLNQMNGNVIAAIQSYNNGPNAVLDMIKKYAYSCGKTVDEVLETNDLGWLDYRSSSYSGDCNYLENVLRYFSGDTVYLETQTKKY